MERSLKVVRISFHGVPVSGTPWKESLLIGLSLIEAIGYTDGSEHPITGNV